MNVSKKYTETQAETLLRTKVEECFVFLATLLYCAVVERNDDDAGLYTVTRPTSQYYLSEG